MTKIKEMSNWCVGTFAKENQLNFQYYFNHANELASVEGIDARIKALGNGILATLSCIGTIGFNIAIGCIETSYGLLKVIVTRGDFEDVQSGLEKFSCAAFATMLSVSMVGIIVIGIAKPQEVYIEIEFLKDTVNNETAENSTLALTEEKPTLENEENGSIDSDDTLVNLPENTEGYEFYIETKVEKSIQKSDLEVKQNEENLEIKRGDVNPELNIKLTPIPTVLTNKVTPLPPPFPTYTLIDSSKIHIVKKDKQPSKEKGFDGVLNSIRNGFTLNKVSFSPVKKSKNGMMEQIQQQAMQILENSKSTLSIEQKLELAKVKKLQDSQKNGFNHFVVLKKPSTKPDDITRLHNKEKAKFPLVQGEAIKKTDSAFKNRLLVRSPKKNELWNTITGKLTGKLKEIRTAVNAGEISAGNTPEDTKKTPENTSGSIDLKNSTNDSAFHTPISPSTQEGQVELENVGKKLDF